MKRHPYFDLWVILAVPLLALAALALTDTEAKIGSYILKKAPIRESLLSPEPEPQKFLTEMPEPIEPINSIADEITDADTTLRVDESAQTFLIIGDSMTPNLARRLAAYAGKNGHNAVYSVNWDASTTTAWADTNRIEEFIQTYKPTYIFVCLGSNECYIRDPRQRIPAIKKIVAKFDSIPYVWIGPPRFKQQGKYNEMLAEALGKKHFFRSDGLELERESDNIHPVQSASNVWMDSVMHWLARSAHPILTAIPGPDTKRTKLVFRSYGPTRKISKSACQAADSVAAETLELPDPTPTEPTEEPNPESNSLNDR